MKYFNPGAITILLILLANCRIYSEEWPKVMTHSSGVEVTFFQPQIESFDKIMLECRAAIMVQNPKIQDPIWGAVWIKTKVLTDRDTRLISLEDVQVTDTKFPGQDSTRINELKKFLAAELPTWELNITVDDLIASLDSIRITSKDQFKADPPEVIHVEYPAVLITIDGDPVFQKLENTGLEYVVNTPFFITKDPRYDSYYLKGGFLWYKSDNVLEGWEWTKKVPSDLLKFVESKAPDSIKVDPDTIEVKPKILVRTKPAELIETEGKPELAPIEGTSLLYVKNSESDIIVDINSQMHFILISGRWFSAKTLSGSWSFVEPEKLPADFAKIPGDSDMGNVLANVPGTEESKDAILETQIPQTAKVDRNKTIEVKYDGEPKFDNIESSPELEYAVNTDKSVIKFDKTYYCCDNAVWYEATNPKGPWKVSTSIPDEIYEMTPESPVYNVKYV